MRNKFLLLLSATCILVILSCNKGGKTGLLVPKDAIFVMHINTSSLSSKLSWDEIKQSKWFNKMSTEKTDSFSRKLMEDPEASGVDLKGAGLTLFIKKQGNGGYGTFQGTLKDAVAFEKFVKETNDNDVEIAKSGDLSYAKLDRGEAVVTWNKSKFVIVRDAPLSRMNTLYGNSSEGENFSADSLLLFAKSVYDLSGSDLLDNNEKFADLMKSSGDVHFFVSMENLYGGMAGGIMSLMKVSTLMKDNLATGTLNFDNGKITLDGTQYYGKELAAIMGKYPSREVNNETINRLPTGDVLFAAAVNYPIEILAEIVKISGADGLANGFLGEKGLTLADFEKALTGEMAFALRDIVKKKEVMEYEGIDGKKVSNEYTKSDPNYVVGIGVKDQGIFDKIYSLFMNATKDEAPKGISIKNEKKWMVVSNDEATSNLFLAGNNKPAYADKLKGHSFALYFNINKAIGSMAATDVSKDSTAKAMVDLSLATWQDGLAYADYKKSSATFKMELNLSDKSINSLKQINRYADQMSVLEETQRKKMSEKWESPVSDSTVPAAPLQK